MLLLTFNFFSQSFSIFDVTPRAPFTTGTTTNNLWQVPDLFHFPSYFFVIVCLFLYFQHIPFVPRLSNINNATLFSVLQSTTMSSLLCWMTWSVWIIFCPTMFCPCYSQLHLQVCDNGLAFCTLKSSEWLTHLFPQHILYFSDIFWPSMFFLMQFILKTCSCAANIKPTVFSSNDFS